VSAVPPFARGQRAHVRTVLLLALVVAAPGLAQQPARWRLVEEWRVGGAVQGPHAFDAVRDIEALPDGRLLVLEGKDQQVHILGVRGAHARTIGRTGSGPGEFRNAIGIVLTRDGGFVVNDADNSRYTFFSATGDLVRTVSQRGFGAASPPWIAQIDTEGRLVEFGHIYRPLPDQEFQSWPARRVFNQDMSRVDTIVSAACANAPLISQWDMAYRVQTGERGYWQAAYQWIRPNVREVVDRDGSVWTGIGLPYRRIHRTTFASCTPLAVVELGGPALTIPRDVRGEVQAGYRRLGEGQAGNAHRPNPDKVPEALPPFEALGIDATRRLWVERFTGTGLVFSPGSRTTQKGTPGGERHFEVFGERGALVARVAAPDSVTLKRPIAITQEHLYALVPDTDGILHLVAFRIQR
jgi:hypothetical protein